MDCKFSCPINLPTLWICLLPPWDICHTRPLPHPSPWPRNESSLWGLPAVSAGHLCPACALLIALTPERRNVLLSMTLRLIVGSGSDGLIPPRSRCSSTFYLMCSSTDDHRRNQLFLLELQTAAFLMLPFLPHTADRILLSASGRSQAHPFCRPLLWRT